MVKNRLKSPGLTFREAHCKPILIALIGNYLKKEAINE